MPTTRRSEANVENSPAMEKTAGAKRKAGEATSPESTKSKRPSKEQKTLEESIPKTTAEQEDGDTEMRETENESERHEQAKGAESTANQDEDGGAKAKTTGKNAFDDVKADEKDAGKTSKPEGEGEAANGEAANGDDKGTAVEEDKEREKAQPTNVLEKGIIYFFTRGRVGMDNPSSVTELQRSFFVLRPLPAGAKITDGAIPDVGNNRLVAVPKKVWPKSGRDRFMAFVEKGKTTMDDLKESFFQGSDYTTQTTGTRHTPEITPIGEGVYAMTSTGDGRTTTHLAYMLTIPNELGEVQKDVGLQEKGSFVLSTKNPESSSPSYAQLPATAEYPKEMLEEFGSRGWLPTKPEHLDYENASILLIGEDADNALEATAQDKKSDEKEEPEEELIKLEEEDEERIKNLKGDDSVYEDLGISSKEYPKLKSTW